MIIELAIKVGDKKLSRKLLHIRQNANNNGDIFASFSTATSHTEENRTVQTTA